MRESGIEAAFRDQDPPIVAFRHGGQQFMMGLAWADEVANWQAADEFARSVRQAAHGGTVVLLSMPGFTPNAAGAAAVADPSRTLMWDRTHLEAVLCGLVALPDLLEASIGAAFFDNMSYATLARLLTGSGEADRAGMATPDRLPPPWAVLGDAYNGVPAAVALVGEEGWDQPSGIAALDADRLVIVTAAGLVELDAVRGGTTWIMRLADSVNEPLVMPDGSVLVACRHAVVRIKDGVLEAAAGGFDANVHLLAGPDGEPWALSGLGATLGTACWRRCSIASSRRSSWKRPIRRGGVPDCTTSWSGCARNSSRIPEWPQRPWSTRHGPKWLCGCWENLLGILLAGGLAAQDAAWAADILAAQVTYAAIEAELRRTDPSALAAEITANFARLPTDDFPLITAHAAQLVAGDVDERFRFAIDVVIDGVLRRASRR